MNTHDDKDATLSVALAELADTMPEDSHRIDGIHARAQRLRTRRRARRAAAGLVVAAAMVAGIIAVRPGPSAVSTVPASPSSEPAVPALPACSTLTPPALEPNMARAAPTEADQAKAAAAASAPSPTGDDAAVNGFTGVKGFGTVTAVSDTSITVTLEDQGAGVPAEVSAGFTDTTSFYDAAAELPARPDVNAGDRVAFAVVVNFTGGYDLLLLDVHPPAAEADQAAAKPDTGEVSDARKAAAAAGAADDTYVKGIADIVSVQPGSLTVSMRDGTRAGQSITAALAPDVTYTSGDQKCADAALAAGQVVGILLARGDGDAYTVQAVALFQP
jgi:hypothetical protein